MKYSCLQANENRDITCHYTEKRFYFMATNWTSFYTKQSPIKVKLDTQYR